ARAERLPGTVVRKRISRYRRALRARWLGPLALILVVAGFSARALHRTRGEILPDDVRRSARAPDGAWRIDRGDPDPQTPPEVRAVAALEARSVRIHVDGKRVRLTSPMRTATYRIVSERRDGDAETLLLRDDAGRERR